MTIAQTIRPMTAKTWFRTMAPRPTPSAAHAAVMAGVPTRSQITWLVVSSSGMPRMVRIA